MRTVEIRTRIKGSMMRNKDKIEKATETKLLIIGEKVNITGESVNEYLTEDIIRALNLGFKINIALKLIDQDYCLKIIDLKQLKLPQHKIKRQISRVIGENGKSKKMLEVKGSVKISIIDDKIGIIGIYDYVDIMVQGILRLIEGSPHRNVYRYIKESQLRYETQDMKKIDEI